MTIYKHRKSEANPFMHIKMPTSSKFFILIIQEKLFLLLKKKKKKNQLRQHQMDTSLVSLFPPSYIFDVHPG